MEDKEWSEGKEGGSERWKREESEFSNVSRLRLADVPALPPAHSTHIKFISTSDFTKWNKLFWS